MLAQKGFEGRRVNLMSAFSQKRTSALSFLFVPRQPLSCELLRLGDLGGDGATGQKIGGGLFVDYRCSCFIRHSFSAFRTASSLLYPPTGTP
jgi:hypothetical protein